MSLVPSLKEANLAGTLSFTVDSFLPYLRLTVKIFQFLRLGRLGQLSRIWKVQRDWLSVGKECCPQLSSRLWGVTKHELP